MLCVVFLIRSALLYSFSKRQTVMLIVPGRYRVITVAVYVPRVIGVVRWVFLKGFLHILYGHNQAETRMSRVHPKPRGYPNTRLDDAVSRGLQQSAGCLFFSCSTPRVVTTCCAQSVQVIQCADVVVCLPCSFVVGMCDVRVCNVFMGFPQICTGITKRKCRLPSVTLNLAATGVPGSWRHKYPQTTTTRRV